MSELVFLQDLAIVMVVGGLATVTCRWLRLPIVLGYILAGFVIGPHTPPYSLVKDTHSIHTLSALGVIFLLFSIGMEFSIKKLLKVGPVASFASLFEIVLMMWVGYSIGKLMGWSQMNSLFLGAILSISSTTIIAKILLETNKMNEKFAQVVLGILVVEDLWAIVIIAVLSGIATTGAFTSGAITLAMAKVFIFIISVLFVGFLFVPRILNYIEKYQLSEMMIIGVLGLCFGASLIAAKSGFSIALGAFLIGAVIAETKQAHDIVTKMEPIRDMFTAIFFVSIGMLIDPKVIGEYWVLILVLTIVTIVGKVFACSLATFLTGYDSQTSLKVGLGLAQIGEFSFIIAQLGLDTKVTGSFLYPIAVSVSALTTITTPLLMNNSTKIIDQIKRFAPKPITTFAHFYPSWISKIAAEGQGRRQKLVIYRDVQPYILKFIFYLVCVIALYVIASRYRFKFDFVGDNAYWSIITVLIFPFLIGFVYTLDNILWKGVFLNLVKSKKEIYKDKTTEEFIHNTIRFLAALSSALVFLLVASVIIPTVPLTVFIVVLVLTTAGFFWKSTRRVHEHIEKTIQSVMDSEKPLTGPELKTTHDQLVDLIRSDYPLSFETQDILLPFQETAANATIKELDLRFKTGASIVGIYRESQTIPNPSPAEKLLPGDVVVLIGSEEQIKAAMAYLQEKMRELR